MGSPYAGRALTALALCATFASAAFVSNDAFALTPTAYVQSRRAEIVSGNAIELALSRSNQAGNLLVAFVVWDNPGSVGLSDSLGNEYVPLEVEDVPGDSPLRAQIFFAANVQAGTNAVTATFSNAIAGRAALHVHEYANVGVDPFDTAVSVSGTGPDIDGGSFATASSRELLFVGIASDARSIQRLTRGTRVRSRKAGILTADRFGRELAGDEQVEGVQNGTGWVMQVAAFQWRGKVPAGARYPVQREDGKRHLVDQDGDPFLLNGDSPQSLFVNLSLSEAATYFANRSARGFNAVWINLICGQRTGGRPSANTYDEIHPFLSGRDLTQPNEEYFARVDEMLRLAARYGIMVLLNPAETQEWLGDVTNLGVDGAYAYGQYLGRRYHGFDNIVWMHGDDYQDWNNNSAGLAAVQAVARGIRDTDPAHIHTVQLDFEVSGSLDDPSWAPIIDLSATYTYAPTYAQVLRDYHRGLPTFMVEANYEFEENLRGDNSAPRSLRKQAYWTMLSGATGHLYGNGYTWPFAPGWKGKYDTKVGRQMGDLRRLLESLRWYDLVPDESHAVVTAGFGEFGDGDPQIGPEQSTVRVAENEYVTSAATSDGSVAISYLPTMSVPITVHMGHFSGPVLARWFDPSSGSFRSIKGGPFPNSGERDFLPPGLNRDKDPDWVLVLQVIEE
jgi:Protein of unknown function (DUF4038)/Putative collagen-binding domain of a collagenase